jgi:hypothetical protein
MKLFYSSLVVLAMWTSAAWGGQAAQGDTVVVSPTVARSVQPVQWRRYARPYYRWGGYYPYYRSYYSYRPYWDGGAFYSGPGGGGFYFGW